MKVMESSNDWELKSLRDLATINYGRSPAAILSIDGLYPVVGTGGTERIGNDYLHEGESIILGRKGTIDRVHFATGRFWTIDTAYYLSDFKESVPLWLFYFLQAIDLRQMNEATGVPSLSRDLLYKLQIPTPPKPEQTKIAEILSTVDRAIEQTEALIAKQQRIKTGLMQDLLTRGIDEHGNLRSEQTHEFKDSMTALGKIPVEWEVKRMRESCEVCNNLRKPIAALVRENMKGNYPYYGPTGILNYINEYRVDGKFVLIGEDGDHFLKFKTHEMTLLVDGKYNVNNHAHILRGKGNILTEWLHLFFLHRDITLHLTRQGAGRFKLNKAALLELLLFVPKEPAEQDRILKVMNTLRQNQISTIDNLNKLKSKKTALMQDLLTGKKRVTALLNETEAASV